MKNNPFGRAVNTTTNTPPIVTCVLQLADGAHSLLVCGLVFDEKTPQSGVGFARAVILGTASITYCNKDDLKRQALINNVISMIINKNCKP